MIRSLRKAAAGVLLTVFLTAAITVPAGASAPRFSDVPPNCWAAPEIARSVQAGLFRGETAGTFGLGHRMTRAAFVTVLCRLMNWQTAAPDRGTFADNQDPSAWYYGAVETAAAEGAVARQSDRFRPNDPITREEMAVMLVRALGCGPIAGLSRDLPAPFTDVVSNPGYLSMAYRLGITGGTGGTLFSPDAAATREQAAVMLMRVYDKLRAPVSFRLGIAEGPEGLTDLAGYDAVAVAAGELTRRGDEAACDAVLTDAACAALREKIRDAGALALLCVRGTSAELEPGTSAAARSVADAAEAGGWDGVLLDFPALEQENRSDYTALAAALKAALGDLPLYVTAEASSSDAEGGYDYAALGRQADGLILRIAAREELTDGFPMAAPEPPEGVYAALYAAAQAVPPEKLSLWLTTTGSVWTGSQRSGTMAAEGIEALLSSGEGAAYRSERYGASYLVRTGNGARTVIWYEDAEGAALRLRLASFLGVHGVCLSDLSSVAAYADYSLLPEGMQ